MLRVGANSSNSKRCLTRLLTLWIQADPSASLVAESTGMRAASSSTHSTLAFPDENKARKSVEIQQSPKNNQPLVHGLIPGGTFQGWTFNFTVNPPGSNSKQKI